MIKHIVQTFFIIIVAFVAGSLFILLNGTDKAELYFDPNLKDCDSAVYTATKEETIFIRNGNRLKIKSGTYKVKIEHIERHISRVSLSLNPNVDLVFKVYTKDLKPIISPE